MIYGYARVSTAAQEANGNGLDAQVSQLEEYGCDIIVKESFTGKTMDRPKFTELMKQLKATDTLVVCKLDRFARTTIDGVQTCQELFDRGVRINILNMGMIEDTTIGRLILTIMLGFAEFERSMILERTKAGKEIARTRPDFREGRPRKFKNAQISHALELLAAGSSYKQVEEITGISKATLYRAKIRKEENV